MRAFKKSVVKVTIPFSLFVLAGASQSAFASFQICNRSHDDVYAAIAYNGDSAAEGLVSQGWWDIRAGECATVISGSAEYRIVRVFVETPDSSKVWGGNENLCVDPVEGFKIYNAQSIEGCTTKGFKLVSSGSENFVYSIRP